MDQWTNARPSLGPNGRDSPQPHGGTVGRPRGYASDGRGWAGGGQCGDHGRRLQFFHGEPLVGRPLLSVHNVQPCRQALPLVPKNEAVFCIWHSQYPRCANYAQRRVKHCTAKAAQNCKKNFTHDEISCWPYKISSERNSENFSKKTLLEDCKSVQNFLPPVFPLTTTARKCKTIAKKYKKKTSKK